MKTFTKIIAIAMFSLPLLANAAGKTASASMQVSFEVKESCTVQSSDKAAKAEPAVACQLKTPYQLNRSTEAAATSSDSKAAITTRQDANSDTWTVYF